MDFFLTLQNVAVLFLLIVIGMLAGRLGIVDLSGQRQLTQLVLKVTLPATIILAMQQTMDDERVATMLQLIGIMLLCYLVITLGAYAITRRYRIKDNQKDVHLVGLMLSNTSFMGFPIILALLGPEALFYAVIAGGLVFEIIAWTLGRMLIGRTSSQRRGGGWRGALINPGVISILIGLSLFLTQTSIPEPIYSTMRMLAGATSPLAMMVVGLMLSRSRLREVLSNPTIYLTAALKLLVIPLVILSLLRLFGISGMRQVIPVIMLALPTAAYVAMFSADLGNDDKLASHLVFVTSLLSVITIPFIASLLQL